MLIKLNLLIFFFPIFSQAQLISNHEIKNFHQVNETLYRGGRPTQAGLVSLARIGVKTIINLQGGDLHSIWKPIIQRTEKGELPASIEAEKQASLALKLNFRSYPLNSLKKITAEEDLVIQKILSDLQNPELQPIFIHCEHGKDRTGLIIALERVKHENWCKADAKKEWYDLGHNAQSRIFTGSLDAYFNQSIHSD